MFQAIRHIYKNHGILGLWRGSSSAVPRVSVASGVQMITFEKSLGNLKTAKLNYTFLFGFYLVFTFTFLRIIV